MYNKLGAHPMFMKFLTISPVILLMSCASLTEEACRTGDWESIGLNDGVRGRYETHLNQHREACGEYGIAPNSGAWLLGRVEGLKQYCTPLNSYLSGRQGAELNAVCPASQVTELKLANLYGLRFYEIGEEITALEEEKVEILLLLAGDPSDEVIAFLTTRISDINELLFKLKVAQLYFDVRP